MPIWKWVCIGMMCVTSGVIGWALCGLINHPTFTIDRASNEAGEKEPLFVDYPSITDKMREAAKVMGVSDEKINASINQGWFTMHNVSNFSRKPVVEFESWKVWTSEGYWDAVAVMMKEVIRVLKVKEEERNADPR